MKDLKIIFNESNNLIQDNLSEFACKDNSAWRLIKEDKELRSNFAVDRDRILYSGAYRRYQGKTQVFSFTNMIDEEMTNRSLHTTYVSQIARTIGKILKLNLELIEAIALGHDLGHTPFGHEGERALNECCQKYHIGNFRHNIASLFIVDHITKRGNGLNLTFQVRDGIISHDGETDEEILKPNRSKTEQDIIKFIKISGVGTDSEISDITLGKVWMPSTLEGCVVRISDTIAYIGQDIEDAIRFNILKRKELPKECVEYFGNNNSDIINTLIKNIIANSYEKDYIRLDETAYKMLTALKAFNYERIYRNPTITGYTAIVARAMKILFPKYIDDIVTNNHNSKIYRHFLNHKSEHYLETFLPAEKVRDFITTMTDRYFNEEVKNYLIPWKY